MSDFANSVAAKLRSSSGIGTITVSYRLAWKDNWKQPADEPAMQMRGAPGGGIASGRRRPQIGRVAQGVWLYGFPRAIITIRYLKPND